VNTRRADAQPAEEEKHQYDFDVSLRYVDAIDETFKNSP